MKYHYFHGRLTYSVKRSGTRSRGGLGRSLSEILILELKPGRWFVAGRGEPRGRWGLRAGQPVRLLCKPRGRLRSDEPQQSLRRSALRTVTDGEFDWGGTSVKR